MHTKLALFTIVLAAGCGKGKDAEATRTAKPGATGASASAAPGTAKAGGPATPVAPPPAAARPGFTATLRDGTTKIGPLAFDHQIITDDGDGNHMALLIANCPQITESCSIAKYLRENTELLDQKCPTWAEIAIVFAPKDQQAKMGPVTVPTGAFSSADDQPLRIRMVEYSDSASAKAYHTMQLNDDKAPIVQVTRSDAKGMAGTFSVKRDDGKGAIEGSFDAKACACDQNTGVCS